MKYFLYIILSMFIVSPILSNDKSDCNITGHVISKKTGEHVPYYSVSIKGTTIGVATDASGHYFLKNLPKGKIVLVASGIGYKSIERQLDMIPGKSIEVNFEIEEDVVHLDGIVVSANRNEVNRKEAPTIVNVLTSKLMENINAVCVAQGLNFQTGLRVETNCQNCGFQQVRINGLDGTYSQILIDSRPIFSALASVYGIEQIPSNMIERVEVMRGGGSALFGSNAIAGVVNIITKEPSYNTVNVSNTTNLIYGKAADINTSLNASVISDNNTAGIVIFGSTRQRKSFDYDGDGFSEIGKIDAKNIGLRGYYKTTNYTKISFEYHNLGEFRRGGNMLDRPPHETDITEQTEHNINTGGLKFDLFSKDNNHRASVYAFTQNIIRNSYYGAQKDPNAYGKTSDITFVAGFQYSYSINKLIFLPSVLTLGSEYQYNAMKDEMLGYNRIIDQKVNTKSMFIQNEWKNSKLSLLIGIRFDKHNLIKENILSPRLNLRYNINDNAILRGSFSSGFRAPQAFDEDLHVTAVGGEVTLIRLDPNLKTEKSKSFSASIDIYKDFGKIKSNFLIEGFYTNLKNVFLLEEIGNDSGGNIILERRNGSGAVVRGINLEGKLVPSDNVELQIGMTFQKSLYNNAQKWSDNPELIPHKMMFRTPNQYGYLTANYQPINPLIISLSGTYTGRMIVQHFAGYIPQDSEYQTPSFYDINLKFSYDFLLKGSGKMQFNCGIQNILNSYQDDFDKGEYRDAGYMYGPSLPRTLFVGLKISL